MSCGAEAHHGNAAETYSKLIGELGTAVAQGPGAVEEINLGAIGDFEFTNAMGANADAAIMTRLNNVDGFYSQQLGVQLNVAELETFTDPADPFSDTTDAAGSPSSRH